MDASHVQEFTARSLEWTLGAYFDRVEMYYQFFPNFWEDAAKGIPRTLTFEDVAIHRIEDVPDLGHRCLRPGRSRHTGPSSSYREGTNHRSLSAGSRRPDPHPSSDRRQASHSPSAARLVPMRSAHLVAVAISSRLEDVATAQQRPSRAL